MHGLERHCNILFASAQEAANGDNERYYLAGFVDQNILDIADLVLVGVLDILFVPVSDGQCLAGQSSVHLRAGIVGRCNRRR
jgi:hypothetical protein